MPDLSFAEISALHNLLISLSDGLALALSEQVNQQVTLDAPEVDSVPIQDVLFSNDTIVQTVFSMSAPLTSESLLYLTDDASRVLLDFMEGRDAAEPPEPFADKHLALLTNMMTALAQSIATALSISSGSPIDLEANSTTRGSITLPPVFAMEGTAVQAKIPLSVADRLNTQLTFLFTPDIVRLLIPHVSAEPEGSLPSGQIIGEDDLAAMLSGLSEEGSFDMSGGGPPAGGMGGGGFESAAAAPFAPFPSNDGMPRGLELILDIPLEVTVELGRVRMLIKDVLELSSGSIVELDRVAGEPVDLLVNGRLVAKGEVVVIEDNFGIRITEIISPAERVSGLGKGW